MIEFNGGDVPYELGDIIYMASLISFELYDCENKWYKDSTLRESNLQDSFFLADKVEKFIGSKWDDFDKELLCCLMGYVIDNCDEWEKEYERGDWSEY